MSSEAVGSSHLDGLPGCIIHCHTHGWFFSLPTVSVGRHTCHVLGIADILGTPLQLLVHSHSFTYGSVRSCLQVICPCTHCLASKAFFWNLSRSLYHLITLACCMSAKQISYGWCQSLPHHDPYLGPLEKWLQGPLSALMADHRKMNPRKTIS